MTTSLEVPTELLDDLKLLTDAGLLWRFRDFHRGGDDGIDLWNITREGFAVLLTGLGVS